MKTIEDPVKLAKKLVSISSVSGNEIKMAEFIYNYLTAIGLKPELQTVSGGRANVLLKGSGELLVNGHMDTVPIGERSKWKYDPAGQLTKTRLYGRGSCDTKGSIACFLAAMAKNPTKKVSFNGSIGEENDCIGIKALMKLRKTKLRNIKSCINLEPTSLRLVTAHKGQIRFLISAKGKAAHSSIPEKGKNAILALNKVIAKIDNHSKKLKKIKHLLVGHATLNIGVIKGGTGYNTVPDYAELEIGRRTVPNEDVIKYIKEFKKLAWPAQTRILHHYNAVELKQDTILIKKMQNILRNYNLPSKTIGVKWTSEFSELKEHGIQGVIFGAGNVMQAHNIDEFASISELKNCSKIFSDLLLTDL